MTGDNNTHGAVRGSSFTKAFLMGLVVGVIVGGFAGAFLPPLIEGARTGVKDTRGTPKPASKAPRDENREQLAPADGAKPEEKPEEKKPETPAGDPSKPNG